MVRRLASWVVVLACVGLWGSGAGAQLPADPPFFAGTLEEALEKSKREQKVLVVYMHGPHRHAEDAFEKVGSHTLMNRSLQQWLQWHAVLVEVHYEENPALYQRIESSVGTRNTHVAQQFSMRRDPYFVVFRRGKMEDVFPRPYLAPWGAQLRDQSNPMDNPRDPLRGRYHKVPGLTIVQKGHELSDENYIKPLELLLNLSVYLDRVSAKDPTWGELHALRNPSPAPPPQADLAGKSDENGAAWPPEDSSPTIWETLEHARTALAERNGYEATGPYTWLWERMSDGRPWLEPLRRTIVASEMRDAARMRKGTLDRFTQIRDNAAARYAWAEFVERWDWMILNEIVGDPMAGLLEMDLSLNDPDEGSLATRSERTGLALLAARPEWLDVWKVTVADVERLDALRSGLRQHPPANVADEEWAHVLDLRRAMLLTESCRVYAAFLRQGRDADAMKAARPLLDDDRDGTARLALAAMAWAAGVASASDAVAARHRAWVEEARTLGADDAGLGAMLPGGSPGLTAE